MHQEDCLAEKPSHRYRLAAIVWCALLAALLFQAGLVILHLFLDITFPYPLDYGEGIALDRAIALANGESLYLPMDRPPYISWNFPPLYAWICGLGARWAGPGFAFGRLVSAASILITAACVYLLARRHIEEDVPQASRIWGLVAALLYLGSTPVIVWGALMRVDSLAIALGLSGYTAVVTGLSPVLAGLLFGAAILCKQSVVAGLLAAGLMLTFARRWRDLALVLASCALLVGSVLAWQHLATDGGIWEHIILCNANAWRFDQLRWVAGPVVRDHSVLLLMAVLGAVWPKAGRSRAPRNPGLYYLVSAALVSLLVGKVGSTINYLLDLTAATSIMATGFAARLDSALDHRIGGGIGAMVAPWLLCLHAWNSLAFPPIEKRVAMGAATAAVVRTLARAPGPVIAEDPGLVPTAGKPLWLQPFEFTQMAEAGRWNQEPLLAALRQGEFSFIVLRFDPWNSSHRDPEGTWAGGRFTDEMVAAMRDSYQIAERYYTWVILRPLERDGAAGTR